jgi:hypothetical protein
MDAIVRRCAAAALSIGITAPVAAAERPAYSFETCVAKRECRQVSQKELTRLRGGFTVMTRGGLVEFTFGISQAVFVNNQLVAVTQIVSELGQTMVRLAPSSVPVEVLTAALQSASIAVGSSTGAAVGATQSASRAATQGAQAAQPALQAASGAASQGAQAAQPALQAASGTASQGAQAAQPPIQAASGAGSQGAQAAQPAVQAASSAASNAAQAASSATSGPSTVVVNGTPIVPGQPVVLNLPTAAELRSLVVQNGLGNSAPVINNGAAATIIQNSVDGAAIRTMTVLDVSAKIKNALSAVQLQDSIRQSLRLR